MFHFQHLFPFSQYTLDEATALLTEIERQEKASAKAQAKAMSPIKPISQSEFPEDQEEDWDKEIANDT